MITRDMLRNDWPIDIRTDGRANVVLALAADHYYTLDGSNSYLPRWQTMTAVWYRNHHSDYLGWIELEEVGMPEFAQAVQ